MQVGVGRLRGKRSSWGAAAADGWEKLSCRGCFVMREWKDDSRRRAYMRTRRLPQPFPPCQAQPAAEAPLHWLPCRSQPKVWALWTLAGG